MNASRGWIRRGPRRLAALACLALAAVAAGQGSDAGAPAALDANALDALDGNAPGSDANSEPAPSFPQAPQGARITAEGWFAPPDGYDAKPARPAGPERVYVLGIRDEQDMGVTPRLYDTLRRKASEARAGGAELVVFDVDTWGGRVDAAMDICRLIKTELADVYTVCFVRTRAISAGSMIAMACDEIVMSPVGKLGDSAPISMGGTLEGVEREKIETVIRQEFTESAERNGYSVALAVSMVSMNREVWLVRRIDTRELRYELRKDFASKVVNPPGGMEVRGDPSRRGGDWEYLRTVVQDNELLTVTPGQAVEMGLASRIVAAPAQRPFAPLLETFDAAGVTPIIPSDSWSERLVTYLTHPAVVSILVLVGLMGFYSEMMSPGLGVPAAVAVCCFGLVFGAPYLTGLATWWEIGLFVVGVVLIALEVFVIPGFGVAGITGILCCAVGFLGIFIANPPDELPIPSTDLDWSRLGGGALALLVAIVGSALGLVMLTKYFPDMPLLNRLALQPGKLDEKDVGVSESAPVRRVGAGDVGVVESVCRPVGAVRFGEDLLDAQSEGSVIAAGRKVRVLRRDGNCVVVEEIWDA